MHRPIATLDHLHPRLAILDQATGKSRPRRFHRAVEIRHTVHLQEILQRIPGQLMRELKGLDQPLLLQLRKLPLPRQHRTLAELRIGTLEVIKTLNPANVGAAHGGNCNSNLQEGKTENLTVLQ